MITIALCQLEACLKSGNNQELGLPITPLGDIEKWLTDIGFVREENENPLNGWQVDFFYYYNHSIYGRWILMGGLWYGDYKFCKDYEKMHVDEERP